MESHCEAELLFVIGNARQTIFPPAIGAGAGLVMTEVVPSVSILAVVFANRAPLSFTEIRSPFFPRNSLLASVIQPMLLVRFPVEDCGLMAWWRHRISPFCVPEVVSVTP
jgi:hypothetical protein